MNQQEPSVEKVQKTLLDLLEDSKPLKKQPSTLQQFAAILVQNEKLADYRNPDKSAAVFVH
jgi:hypothetical protein